MRTPSSPTAPAQWLAGLFLYWLLICLPLGSKAQSAPQITSFSPTSGPIGTIVTVTGTNLTGASASINGVAGVVQSSSATALTFAVSVGSTNGPLAVRTSAGTATGTTSFTVTPTLLPAGFEPVDTISTPANGGYTALSRCDDCTQQVELGFAFSLYNKTYTSCYINNNGILSFTQAVSAYNTSAFPLNQGPLIAPYWADVDTGNPSGGRIWYKVFPDRLVVLWSKVGYYNQRVDKKNTFQLIIRRNTVVPYPAADVTFAYGSMSWMISSDVASATYPQVGFDAGDGVYYYNYPFSRRANIATMLNGNCLNYQVAGKFSQTGFKSFVNNGITSFAPNPAGAGQEVMVTGPNMAGASSIEANNVVATSSISNNTTTSLTFRVPSNATLAGTTLITTASGTNSSTGLNVLPAPGQALAFDGTNDVVQVPHAAALNLTSALTLEAWVRTSSTTEQYLVTKSEDSWYLGLNAQGATPGRASFYLNGPSAAGGWLHGTRNLADGRWHHVAGTYDGDTLRLYVDGLLENKRAATGPVATGTAPLLLGSRPSKPFLAGSLDEVRIWRTARTADELTAGLNQPPALPDPNLVAYFNFDRGLPGGQNQAYTRFHEVVNGWPATLSNFALSGTTSNWVESYALVVPMALGVRNRLSNSFTLKWQQPARGTVISYVAEVSRSPNFTPTVATATITGAKDTAYTVSGLMPGTRYYYRVRAERPAVVGQSGHASGSLIMLGATTSCGTNSITNVSPISGTFGDSIKIIGNLSTLRSIAFGGVPAPEFRLSGNGDFVSVRVPLGAVSGTIEVKMACGTLVARQTFTVNRPVLSKVQPAAELPGQPVTITGTGFTPSSTVRFGDLPAARVIYNSPTSLTAIVPGDASFMPSTGVRVSTLNGDAATISFQPLRVANTISGTDCQPSTSEVTAADSTWRYVLRNGAVVLAYKPVGTTLGTVSVGTLQSAQIRSDGQGQQYLARNWRPTTTASTPPTTAVQVRFYGLTNELEQLQAAAPGQTSTVSSSLRLVQYMAATQDCSLSNNTSGTTRALAVATAYGPGGSDFFVTTATVPNFFSELYLATGTSPLPVELTDFRVARVPGQRAVRLHWSTATELNSAYFAVERSFDGSQFASVGTVTAVGSSSTPRAYTFTDVLPAADSRLVYYRLRAVDQDASFSFSPVRSVALDEPALPVVYPNPAHRTATLAYAAAYAPVLVCDLLGRPVLTTRTDASGSARLQLPADLARGVYLVRAGSAPATRLVVE